MKTFYISTSIPYVNAAPHIGHALEFVQADVLARFRRQRGEDVFFLTGTDDNALKNVQAAEAAGASPREWVDRHAGIFKNFVGALEISNDDFIRTSAEARHIRGAQKLWLACRPEDIYKKKYRGLYCLGCEAFKTPVELVSGECPEHEGRKLEEVEEENYFFRLSNYGPRLEKLIESGELAIIPEGRRRETLNFIKFGLEDFSISRSRARAKGWGVEVPNDSSQIMYVWFDALSNYINALGYADEAANFKKYWISGDEILHIIGKGINRFHTVYWPAMLLSAGLPLPKKVFIHGYLTINGQKISKTLGNVVDPFELIKKFGAEAVRYYLLREITPTEDGDYSETKFVARYNADLANGLGNLVARVLALASRRGELTVDIKTAKDEKIAAEIAAGRTAVEVAVSDFHFNEALEKIWSLVALGDKYVNDRQPWAEEDSRVTLLNALVIIDNIAALLKPFLPATAAAITKSIIWTESGARVEKLAPLFPRL